MAGSVGIVSETDSRCLQRFSGAWGTIWDISDLSNLEKQQNFEILVQNPFISFDKLLKEMKEI